MGEVKPWQIALIVIGLLVGVGGVAYQCSRDRVVMADSIVLVDVATGELIRTKFPSKGSVFFPATNPSTQSPTLYPVLQEDSKWIIERRYIKHIPNEPEAKALDRKSGEVRVTTSVPTNKNVF